MSRELGSPSSHHSLPSLPDPESLVIGCAHSLEATPSPHPAVHKHWAPFFTDLYCLETRGFPPPPPGAGAARAASTGRLPASSRGPWAAPPAPGLQRLPPEACERIYSDSSSPPSGGQIPVPAGRLLLAGTCPAEGGWARRPYGGRAGPPLGWKIGAAETSNPKCAIQRSSLHLLSRRGLPFLCYKNVLPSLRSWRIFFPPRIPDVPVLVIEPDFHLCDALRNWASFWMAAP